MPEFFHPGHTAMMAMVLNHLQNNFRPMGLKEFSKSPCFDFHRICQHSIKVKNKCLVMHDNLYFGATQLEG
jgi:hypothetical protein